jgi:hypothetical protein
MNTSRWGRPLWIFLHTFCEKIKPDVFTQKRETILSLVDGLLKSLPCPTCQKDTNTYLKRHNLFHVRTKDQCIKYLFDFHNHVNVRLGKPEYTYLEIFSKQSFQHIYNAFLKYYKNYRSSMFISIESTYKREVCNRVAEYIDNNTHDFIE